MFSIPQPNLSQVRKSVKLKLVFWANMSHGGVESGGRSKNVIITMSRTIYKKSTHAGFSWTKYAYFIILQYYRLGNRCEERIVTDMMLIQNTHCQFSVQPLMWAQHLLCTSTSFCTTCQPYQEAVIPACTSPLACTSQLMLVLARDSHVHTLCCILCIVAITF